MPGSSRRGERIDPGEHHDPEWHVLDVVEDFELIDAWQIPAEGTAAEFSELCTMFLSLDLENDEGSKASQFLFSARDRLGQLFGWDEEVLTQPIPGGEEVSLKERLDDELAATAQNIDGGKSPFQVVYYTDRELLLELSNSTVHAAIHLAWVPTGGDTYGGQMGIFVKTRGQLGRIYMPAIAPFRHYIVYPALMKRIAAGWQQRSS